MLVTITLVSRTFVGVIFSDNFNAGYFRISKSMTILLFLAALYTFDASHEKICSLQIIVKYQTSPQCPEGTASIKQCTTEVTFDAPPSDHHLVHL